MHLGDVPATVTGERLSRGIFTGSILSVAAASLLTAAIVTAEMMTDISRYPVWFYPVTETAAWVIALLPIVGPLYEIWAFSRQSKDDIEEAVRIKEPLQVCACCKATAWQQYTSKLAHAMPASWLATCCCRGYGSCGSLADMLNLCYAFTSEIWDVLACWASTAYPRH